MFRFMFTVSLFGAAIGACVGAVIAKRRTDDAVISVTEKLQREQELYKRTGKYVPFDYICILGLDRDEGSE